MTQRHKLSTVRPCCGWRLPFSSGWFECVGSDSPYDGHFHLYTVVSTGRTVQAEGCRPVRGGPVRGVRTYTFLIGKAVVRGDRSRDSMIFFELLALDIDLMNVLKMTDYVGSVGICPIRDLHQFVVLAVLTLPMLI